MACLNNQRERNVVQEYAAIRREERCVTKETILYSKHQSLLRQVQDLEYRSN